MTSDGATASRKARDALHRLSFVVVAAAATATLAGWMLLAFEPFADPVEVVGLPLLDGYAERNEQYAWYLFVATLLLGGLVFRRFAQVLDEAVAARVGAVATLTLASLPAWIRDPVALPQVSLAALLVYVAAAALARRRWLATRVNPIPLLGLAAVLFGFPYLIEFIAHDGKIAGRSAFGLAVAGWLVAKLPKIAGQPPGDWLWTGTAIFVVLSICVSGPTAMALAAVGAGCFGLGAAGGRPSARHAPLQDRNWLVCILLTAAPLYFLDTWWEPPPEGPAPSVLGGAGAMAIAIAALRPSLGGLRNSSVRRFRIPKAPASLIVVCLLATGIGRPWAEAGSGKPWLAIVAAGMLIAVATFEPIRTRHWRYAFLLATALLVAFLPGKPPRYALDPFHDGQILSAVWEFESGRQLYSEVFPLRGYGFFLTWLSRQVAPNTMWNYLFAFEAPRFLPLAGAALATFAWTRHLAWGLATALVVAVCLDMEPRSGIHLLLAAAAIVALRQRPLARCLWLSAIGSLTGFLGYDVMVPFTAGAAMAVTVAARRGRVHRSDWARAAAAGSAQALFVALAIAGSFSLVVALWQGLASVTAYWSLLIDYSRHYSAFYGMPIDWFERANREVLAGPLVVVAVWASGGVAVWKSMTAWRRRAWIFLLVQFVFIGHRALGRSDLPHLKALTYPSILLGSIALFEGLRRLRALGWRGVGTRRGVVAVLVAAWAVWATPHGEVTPSALLKSLREPGNGAGKNWPAPSTLFLGKVAEGQCLWDLTDGLVNFVNKRHNPTRHAITYCIGSPGEQRVAVAALEACPPPVIVWRHDSGSNEIPNSLFYYIIGQYVFAHYAPSDEGIFLEPAPANWQGRVDLPAPFKGELRLKRLPLRWGRDRVPRLGPRLKETISLEPHAITIDSVHGPTALESTSAAAWEVATPIASRRFNYLFLEVSCVSASGGAEPADARLLFAPAGRELEEESQLTFTAIPDGERRSYLIPIGCSPGWSWRPAVDRIRLLAPEDCAFVAPRIECWRVDDVRP